MCGGGNVISDIVWRTKINIGMSSLTPPSWLSLIFQPSMTTQEYPLPFSPISFSWIPVWMGKVTLERCMFHRNPWLVLNSWPFPMMEEWNKTGFVHFLFFPSLPSPSWYFFCRSWKKRLHKCLQRLRASRMQRRGKRQIRTLVRGPGKWG